MPMRPPRVCSCGRRVPVGQRCACRKVKDRERPSARQRGYNSDWEREAKAFLALPGNERCACGQPATLVRHVISIRKRPDLRMVRSNWRPGCARCNAIDTARDKREAGR